MLVRCKYGLRPEYAEWYHDGHCTRKAQSQDTLQAWNGLLGVVDNLLHETVFVSKSKLTPTRILADYIECRAQRLKALHDIGQRTIEYLLTSGANNNARLDPDGSTPLHLLCRVYKGYGLTGEVLRWGRQLTVNKDMQGFVNYLLAKGADDVLLAGGLTPKEVLVANMCEPDGSSAWHTNYGVAKLLYPKELETSRPKCPYFPN